MLYQSLELLIGIQAEGCCRLGFIVLVEQSRAGNVACLLCLQLLFGNEGCREDGVFHQLEIGIAQLIGHRALYASHLGLELVVGIEVTFQFVAKLAGVELHVAEWHNHVFGLADGGESVVLLHDGQEMTAQVAAQLR